ncbi:MAG TPA: EAL domain-containing protein [Sneathiellales bacterium]|nr:EAL domain-containing protein [Sneathiellales bacterium]
MGLFANLLLIVSYAVIAFAVAVVLPTISSNLGSTNASVIGLMVFIAGTQLHIVYTRRVEREQTENHFERLIEFQGQCEDRLLALEEDFAEIEEILGDDPQAKNSALVAEMLVVREMLESVLEKSDRKRAKAGKSVEQRQARDNSRSNQPVQEPVDVQVSEIYPGEPEDLNSVAMTETHDSVSKLDEEDVFRITRQALEQNRVDLYLQPVVSLPQRKIRFYEAFSRIRDEIGGVIVPEQFLPSAEEAGLVPALDNLLLFRCVQLVRDFKKHRADFGIFLNISSHTLHDQDFFPQFIDFMSHNQELADYLIFEFVEQDAADYSPDVRRNLDELASLGFQFSMDKVSSLNLDVPGLAARHFKFVKVDAEILLAGGGSANDAGTLKQLMGRYGVDLVAAKVETEAALGDLLDFDVDYGQGYLFGEPRPGREGARFLG